MIKILHWFFRGIINGINGKKIGGICAKPFIDFDKFANPKNPLYEDYKDRYYEKWHDIGYNIGLKKK